MHWFSGGTQYFLVSSPPQAEDRLSGFQIEFLALAMLPGLMAIAVTDFNPPLFVRKLRIDEGERV